MATKEIAAAMYYSGERGAASANLGKALVTKGDTIVVESFLQDRPPPFVDVPTEVAEIRVGQKSNFEYDLSVGSKDRVDLIVSLPRFGGVTWPDPPGENNAEDDAADQATTIVVVDIYETDRKIKVVRVEGSDGESWVDVEQIDEITFRMPNRRGPNGDVIEYYKYHLNNDNPIVNGVDVNALDLEEGEQVIDVEDA